MKSFKGYLDRFGINIESSLPLSMLFLCLNGIVNNLQAARIIECNYINCLENEVPAGKPIQVCTMTKGYMQCKWVYGQLFQLIPFASVFSNFAQNIDRALSEPAAAVNMAAGVVCYFACGEASCGACSLCTFYSNLNMIVDLYKDLEQMSQDKNMFKFDDTICESVLKDDEK